MDIPPAALKQTYAGAQAMAKFFVEQLDYGYVTNDPKVIRAISDESCIACSNSTKGYAARKAARQHQLDRSLTVAGFAPYPTNPADKQQVVDVLVDVAAAEVVNASGKVVERIPAGKDTIRVRLSWVGQHWRIDAAGQADQ